MSKTKKIYTKAIKRISFIVLLNLSLCACGNKSELNFSAFNYKNTTNIACSDNELTQLSSNTSEEETIIWNRMRSNFNILYAENNPRIQHYIKHYHQYHIQELAARAEPYLHFILEELEKRDLPAELALLPMVESAFDPYALSEYGPTGIWQIMLAAGVRFGIQQNPWYDGRRDIADSTRAALSYLEHLYRYFDKDWLLAIAAYNSGEGWVKRAIKRNKRLGRPTDFWSLRLPTETRNYVPKLLALVSIVKNSKKYSIKLPHIDDKPYLSVIDIGNQMDLANAAKISEMDLDELKRLNPGYMKWATHPEGPHILLLPVENAAIFEANMQNPDISKHAMASKQYKIIPGDSLIRIAKRFNVSVEHLKERNQLTNDVIIAGKNLFIPFHPGGFKVQKLK